MDGLGKTELVLLCIICLLATSRLAVSIINWLSTILARPPPFTTHGFFKRDIQPTMPHDGGGTNSHKQHAADIDELVEGLEVRFLANRDANLYYALLTDFKDAATETTPEDEMLLQYRKNKDH